MSAKRKIFDFSIDTLQRGIGVFCGRSSAQLSAHLAERLVPIVEQQTKWGPLKFFCPGEAPHWRAQSLLTKEPETIEWIDGFSGTDAMWDIGANIGVYTLYAARRGIYVHAFEPAPANYYVLSRNIEVNGFSERVSSLCLAFSDRTGLDSFYMANTEIGGSLNTFGEATDWEGKIFEATFKQSMLGFTVDDFLTQFAPRFPTHIKIDVDGIESKIVKGASRTLSDRRLISVLVELNTSLKDQCEEIHAIFAGAGLKLHKKEHAPIYDNSRFEAVYNHIFRREA